MAYLYVTEYALAGSDQRGKATQIAHEPPVASQRVTFTGTAAASAAFAATTALVRIHTDADCHIAFGTDPTATTSSRKMVSGQTEYFSVPIGGALKVSAITA
jgi:hypothetical protein